MSFSKNSFKSKIYSKTTIVAVIKQKSKNPVSPFQGTIDYKNVVLLRKFITTEGKIVPRRISGVSAKQQRYIAKAIKNARMMGFLPFINHSQPTRI